MIESFWGVNIHGTTYRVSEEQMQRILRASEEARTEKVRDNSCYANFFEIVDIFGSRIYIDLKGVSSLYYSSSEMREREREHTDYLNSSEKGFE